MNHIFCFKFFITKLKLEKEQQRLDEEKQFNVQIINDTNNQQLQTKLIKENLKIMTKANESNVMNNQAKIRELNRYIDAVKQLIKDKAAKQKIDLPPLCQCNYSNSIWDFNPNNCANNCIFYKNPKGSLMKSIFNR
jgi:hypothetical protein